MENANNRFGEFPKTMFLRNCLTDNPEEDYQAICYLYNVDIVYQMYRKMQEKYYSDFSWEQVTHKNVLTRNEAVINDLRNLVKNKDNKIVSLQRELQAINDKLSIEQDKELIKQIKEESKLNSVIEEKEAEIETLKKRLQLQNEFIEMLNSPIVEEPVSQDVDIAKLQGKRYLFVVYENVFPELNKSFPDSVFMYNDRVAISNIQVDAIVMLVRYMSHSMLFKVKSTNQLQDIPIVYCCGTGVNSIYKDMLNADL